MTDVNTLKDDQQVTTSVAFLDKAGNPANAPTAPVAYASSDSTILTVDATGLVKAVGPLGAATITASVTTDDGLALTGTAAFNVVADSAASFKLAVGTPVAQTPAAPATGTTTTP